MLDTVAVAKSEAKLSMLERKLIVLGPVDVDLDPKLKLVKVTELFVVGVTVNSK